MKDEFEIDIIGYKLFIKRGHQIVRSPINFHCREIDEYVIVCDEHSNPRAVRKTFEEGLEKAYQKITETAQQYVGEYKGTIVDETSRSQLEADVTS